MGIPLPENRKVTTFPFHVFDRYENHIQASANALYGNLSSIDPHLHKITLKHVYS